LVGFAIALILAIPTNQTLNNTNRASQNIKKSESVAVQSTAPQVKVAATETPEPQAQQAQQPVQPTPTVPTGSCEAEISKYDWSQTVALEVSTAESGLDPGQVNYNPSTYDYSVGCFQVNIWGANALTRPSEAELKVASINVAWAYKIYAANGHSFIGQWGVCRHKVACY
jgi:hypothetical protein